MRHTQLYGLTKEAGDFLDEQCDTVSNGCCPHCQKPISFGKKFEVYEDASSSGMFDDGPQLSKYFLNNCKEVKEVIQRIVWSSGPCIFLCLEDEHGYRMFEWPESSMDV
jgi:hypothetical protein